MPYDLVPPIRSTSTKFRIYDDRLNRWMQLVGGEVYPSDYPNTYSTTDVRCRSYRDLHYDAYYSEIDDCIYRIKVGDGTESNRNLYIQTITDPFNTSQWTTWTNTGKTDVVACAIGPALDSGNVTTGYTYWVVDISGNVADSDGGSWAAAAEGCVGLRLCPGQHSILQFKLVKTHTDTKRYIDYMYQNRTMAGWLAHDHTFYQWFWCDVFTREDDGIVRRLLNARTFADSSRNSNRGSCLQFTQCENYGADLWENSGYDHIIRGIGGDYGNNQIGLPELVKLSDGYWYVFYYEDISNPDGSAGFTDQRPVVWQRSKDFRNWSEPVFTRISGMGRIIEWGAHVWVIGNNQVWYRPKTGAVYQLDNYVNSAELEVPRDGQEATARVTLANPNGVNSIVRDLEGKAAKLAVGAIDTSGVWRWKEFHKWWVKSVDHDVDKSSNRLIVNLGDIHAALANPIRDVMNLYGQQTWKDWASGRRNKAFNYYFYKDTAPAVGTLTTTTTTWTKITKVEEGVDFSWGRPGGAALVAAGKKFVVRYVPYPGDGGKGLTAAEITDYSAQGLDIYLVFESTADRALSGYAGGVADAQQCETSLAALGLEGRPVYFAVDFDAQPAQYATVDAYLRGAASIIGSARTGVYAGYYVIAHCQSVKTATWFWQTYAWSYGHLAPGIDLYQYLNNQTINGAAVDLCRAYTELQIPSTETTGITDPNVLSALGVVAYAGWKGHNCNASITFPAAPAGNASLYVRYVDEKNYIRVYKTGTTFKMLQKIDGGDTELASVEVGASAYPMTLGIQIKWGAYKGFYNGADVTGLRTSPFVDHTRRGYVAFSGGSDTARSSFANFSFSEMYAPLDNTSVIDRCMARAGVEAEVQDSTNLVMATVWGPQTDTETASDGLQSILTSEKWEVYFADKWREDALRPYYEKEVLELNPIIYYRYAEGSGVAPKDWSGNGFDLQTSGTVPSIAASALAGDTGIYEDNTSDVIMRRSFERASNASSVNQIVPMPAGIQPGDLLIAYLDAATAYSAYSCTGWTKIKEQTYSTMFYRVADGTEGASQTFTGTAATSTFVGCAAYMNVDPDNPLDGAAVGFHATSISVSVPFTTTSKNAMIVAGISAALGCTETGELTEVWSRNNGTQYGQFDDGIRPIQGTADMSWSVGYESAYVVIAALRPIARKRWIRSDGSLLSHTGGSETYWRRSSRMADPTTQLTVSTWFKLEDEYTMVKRLNSWAISTVGNKIRVTLYQANGTESGHQDTSTTYPSGWHLLTFTYDDTAKEIQIWVDEDAPVVASTAGFAGTWNPSGGYLWVGGSGGLDETFICHSILEHWQHTHLYYVGLGKHLWAEGGLYVGPGEYTAPTLNLDNEIIKTSENNSEERRFNVVIVDGNEHSFIELDKMDLTYRGRAMIQYLDEPELLTATAVKVRAQDELKRAKLGTAPGGDLPVHFGINRLKTANWIDLFGIATPIRVEGISVDVDQGDKPHQRMSINSSILSGDRIVRIVGGETYEVWTPEEKTEFGPDVTKAQLEAAINGHTYDAIEFIGGTYSGLSGLNINVKGDKPLILRAKRGEIVTWSISSSINFVIGSGTSIQPLTLENIVVDITTNNTTGISVAAGVNNLTLDGITITGQRHNDYWVTENGISVNGTSGTHCSGITIQNCDISDLGNRGIVASYCDSFSIFNNRVYDCFYSGIMVLSGANGTVTYNVIQRIGVGWTQGATGQGGAGANNCYGIEMSAGYLNQAVTHDVTVAYNTIEDVPTWHAYGTHGGYNIHWEYNTLRRVSRGFFISGYDPEDGIHGIVYPHHDYVEHNQILSPSPVTFNIVGVTLAHADYVYVRYNSYAADWPVWFEDYNGESTHVTVAGNIQV